VRIHVDVPPFRDALKEAEGALAAAATRAMKEATPELVRELRAQVTSAGLGGRLANTWRHRVYPDQGAQRGSLEPAGFVWSRAPDIISSFVRGATIRPLGGRKYLFIPTDNVPRRSGRRGSTKRMTPTEVEYAFNQDLFIRNGRQGRKLAFIRTVAARSGRGRRRGTAGRLAQGRKLEETLMFVLVRTARMPRLLDLDGPAQRAANRFVAAFDREATPR